MNLEDTLKKHDEEIKRWTIITQDRAALHTAGKDKLKFEKELRKEVLERIANKLKEIERD